MRIDVAVGWPFRYTTCWFEFVVSYWSSEVLESGESDWTFFFLMDLSSEGVEDTEDPAPERKFELFSSIDEFGSDPLRLLARSSAAAFTSWCFPSAKMSSSSSRGLTNSREFPSERSDSFYETHRSEGSTSWWIERSSPQQAHRLSPVLLRRNVWGLEGGTRGLLLPCDGMILTKSNIQRQRGRKTSMKYECKITLKTTYTTMLTT